MIVISLFTNTEMLYKGIIMQTCNGKCVRNNFFYINAFIKRFLVVASQKTIN